MDGVEHRTVRVNGINVHVAEKGQGPIVLFIHGFPSLWYCWRHQIQALASFGYRCVAPDLRGYGDTEAPADSSSYTYLHVVGDMIGVLDAIGADKVFVVGHDLGAQIAWFLCLFRPDRVKALVNLSVVYLPRDPTKKPLETYRAVYGDDFYMCRFQEPGKMEAEFAGFGTEGVLRFFLNKLPAGPLYLPKENPFGYEPGNLILLPLWLSEEELNYYVSKFEKTGFLGGLNYYRNFDRSWELTAPWSGSPVVVPTKFIVGDLDITYRFTGSKEYIESGGFKKNAPLLEEVVVLEGVGHFLQEEMPDEINKQLHDFFGKFLFP